MSTNIQEFNRNAIRPIVCLRSGWSLIKDQYWLFFGISVVGILIGSAVPFGILMGTMMCGIYLALLRRMRGEVATFDMLFKGFDFFSQSLIATLIQVVPIVLLILPFYIIMMFRFMTVVSRNGGARAGTPPDPAAFYEIFGMMALLMLVLVLVSLVIGALFVFTFPLIVDRKLSGVDAIKTSVKAVFGNLGGVFGLVMLTALLGFAGMLVCYVGALFVMPVTLAAWAVAYRQIFPPDMRYEV